MEQIGVDFEVCPAKGEETITKTKPEEIVEELSRQKAEEVASGIVSYNETHKHLVTPEDILVIGADTIVAHKAEILGKPKTAGRRRKHFVCFPDRRTRCIPE